MEKEKIELLKEEFLLTLFEEKKKNLKTKNNNYIQVQIICKNEVLKKQINSLFKKYNIKETYNDFMSEYILHTWKAIDKFEIQDEGSWQGIVDGTDKANIGRLIKYIKTTVGFSIYHYVNEKAKFTTTKDENGNRHHLVVRMDTLSLDAPNTIDGTGTLLDLLTDENLLFTDEEFEGTFFSRWFHSNKSEILTKSQLKFLANLNECKKIEGYTPNDVYEVTGVQSNKVNTRLARISTRIEKAWAEQAPKQLNRLEINTQKHLQLLSEMVQITIEVEGYGQNQALTQWVVDHVEHDYISELLFSKLDSGESKMVNQLFLGTKKGTLPAPLLYKIYSIIEDEIERLETFDTTVMPITPVINEKFQQWEQEKQKRDKQPVTITNAMGVQSAQDYTPERKSKTKIVYVLPSGLQVNIDQKVTQSINIY